MEYPHTLFEVNNIKPKFEIDNNFFQKKKEVIFKYEYECSKWFEDDDIPRLDFINTINIYGRGGKRRGVYFVALSNVLIKYGTWDDIVDTIRHEIAHVLQVKEMGYTAHDSFFYEYCKKVGARPERCKERIEKPEKYKVKCRNENCDVSFQFSRLTGDRKLYYGKHSHLFYSCKKCEGNGYHLYLNGEYWNNKNNVDLKLDV